MWLQDSICIFSLRDIDIFLKPHWRPSKDGMGIDESTLITTLAQNDISCHDVHLCILHCGNLIYKFCPNITRFNESIGQTQRQSLLNVFDRKTYPQSHVRVVNRRGVYMVMTALMILGLSNGGNVLTKAQGTCYENMGILIRYM